MRIIRGQLIAEFDGIRVNICTPEMLISALTYIRGRTESDRAEVT